MTDDNHDHNDCKTKHVEQMSRRRAARYAGNLLLGAGATVLALFSMGGRAKAGYGACSISGCPCQKFQGQQDLCGNCGHKYTDHW